MNANNLIHAKIAAGYIADAAHVAYWLKGIPGKDDTFKMHTDFCDAHFRKLADAMGYRIEKIDAKQEEPQDA